VTESDEVLPGITAIDTLMAGRHRVTAAYLVSGDRPALVETGPTRSLDAVLAGLDALGVGPEDLPTVVVTHIHLDHAGGVGRLARSFPRATIWVHNRGAPHLADPTKLVASAGRVYGEERMARLFGPVDPVPGDRLRALDDGDRIDLGNRRLDVLYTPGHASHHVALADSETGAVFTGDALGIHLPDVRVLRPATPPPDIDVERYVASVEAIKRRARTALLFSHYGPVGEIAELCDLAAARLKKWAGIVRGAMDDTDDLERIAEVLGRETADEFDDAVEGATELDRYEVLGDMKANAAGLTRYWRKRDEAEEEAGAAG
jgi:glyoxylase-like metal-dependent hydrolase (beta-lactamase superfamily II)